PETRWPLTKEPLWLFRSTRRHRGGLTSMRKWSREKNGSFSGKQKCACWDRPTRNVSCWAKENACPACGPAVTRRVIDHGSSAGDCTSDCVGMLSAIPLTPEDDTVFLNPAREQATT